MNQDVSSISGYVVIKKADAYHPTSFKALKWSEILGIAVATMV